MAGLILMIPIILLFLFADPPKPPVIPLEERYAFVKLRLQLTQAQQAAKDATDQINATVKHWTEICGKDFVLAQDAAGEPICTAKPAASATPSSDPAR